MIILLAEDDLLTREAVTELLENDGHRPGERNSVLAFQWEREEFFNRRWT